MQPNGALLRVLIKVAQADGDLVDAERAFIERCAGQLVEARSNGRLDALARQVHDLPVEQVVAPFVGAPAEARERLLHLCVQIALADHEVRPPEREVLGAVHRALGLGGTVLDWIVDEANTARAR